MSHALPRHPALPAGLAVSGHQPLAFGHPGYWSKILAADQHLVTAGVPYAPGDHLGRLMLPDGGCVHLPLLRAGPRIADLVVYRRPEKVMRAVEMAYRRRTFAHKSRVEPILAALDVPADTDYLALWLRLFHAHLTAAGATLPAFLVDIAEDRGQTAQARQQQRLRRLAPDTVTYLAGPGARGYLSAPTYRPVLVHRMREPSTLPFLHTIVTQAEPLAALTAYELETLDVAPV